MRTERDRVNIEPHVRLGEAHNFFLAAAGEQECTDQGIGDVHLRLVRLRPVTERLPTCGSIVLVCLLADIATFARIRGYVPRGTCPGRTAPVGKTALALPGDTVRVLARELELNGVVVPLSLARRLDSRSRQIPSVAWGFCVARPGELSLLGRHALSFDSRYFELVPASTILAVLRPVGMLRKLSK